MKKVSIQHSRYLVKIVFGGTFGYHWEAFAYLCDNGACSLSMPNHSSLGGAKLKWINFAKRNKIKKWIWL